METLAIILLALGGVSFLSTMIAMVSDDFSGRADRFIGGALITGIVSFAAALSIIATLSISQDHAERSRLMAQCLDDGKREYECAALVNRATHGDTQTVVVPMVVR